MSEETNPEVLPSEAMNEPTIADRLDDIPVERLTDEQIAELEKLKQELVYVGIDDIHPSPNKERKNDAAVPKVAESIRQCGFRSPIYVNSETNEIVIGHTRWAAAKKLGLRTVPVVFIFDLSPSKLKLLKLADNKVAEFSGWDFGELNKTIDELKMELPELDLGDLGFSVESDSLDDLFDDTKQEDKGGDGSSDEEEKRTIHCTCPECGHEFEQEV